MTDWTRQDVRLTDLRRRAEAATRAVESQRGAARRDDVDNLVHELQIYQAELEMQNEELREAQRQLERSTHRYFRLFDLAPVAYLVLDQGGMIKEINVRGAHYLKGERVRLLGTPLGIRIGRDSRDDFFLMIRRSIKDDAVCERELVISRPDGSELAVWAVSARFDNDASGAVQILLSMNDITEKKQKERALRDSEAVYRSLVQSSFDHVFMLSPDGFYLASNDRVTALGASSGESLVGRHLSEVYREDIARQYLARVAEVVDTRAPVTFEHDLDAADGTRYHFDTLYPIFRGRDVWAVGGICHDVTEERHMADQKLQLERQLNQAQKMEAIGTLAGGIAHDFNNILGMILGNAELLKEDIAGDPRYAGYTDAILSAGFRARDLVQQILAFSRVTDSAPRPVNVSEIAGEVLAFLKSSLPSSIEIQSALCTEAAVIADPTHIHQIFMNLCGNAAHAIGDDVGRLSITLKDVQITESTTACAVCGDLFKPGRYAVITVADTGVGMDRKTMARVFEPFFTTKDVGQGTGMGLAIVHGIVKTWGGHINVDSALHRGTTFTIWLPAVGTVDTDLDNGQNPVPNHSGNILIVDDETALAKLEGRILERFGYTVTTVTDPQAALALIRRDPSAFDLVITDMTMPRMTGDTLSRHIHDIRKELPIILCTGFSARIQQQTAPDLGVSAVVMKPVDSWKLARTVYDILSAQNKESAETKL